MRVRIEGDIETFIFSKSQRIAICVGGIASIALFVAFVFLQWTAAKYLMIPPIALFSILQCMDIHFEGKFRDLCEDAALKRHLESTKNNFSRNLPTNRIFH